MITWESVLITFILIFLITICSNYRLFYVQYKTIHRDITALKRFSRMNFLLFKWRFQEATVPGIFTNVSRKHPIKIAYHFENESWTYQQLEEFSNKVANYFKSQYKKGDTVALLLDNRVEYIGIWLGLSKIGVITALMNTNLLSDPLLHSINVANCKGIIFGENFIKAINSIKGKKGDLKFYQFNNELKTDVLEGSINLTDCLENQSKDSPQNELKTLKYKDKMLYIYTSGTTGLPKAAIITNAKFLYIVTSMNSMAALTPDDIDYNPLPLYHSAGGILASGQALLFGVTVVIRKKFSASNFWTDCQKYNCTIAHYIGEICRYLLTVHKDGTKIEHNVNKMIGNGLRPQIWKKFVDTFKIENVYEFYGATESNSNLVNIDNKVGSVGFVPILGRYLHPVTLIKCDETTGEPIRDSSGFCIKCKANEPGILLGKMVNSVNSFNGYADEEATQKKVLRNVFVEGDAYFNTGDVLVQDEFCYFYFKDRTGDTFRWKGENVATNEIEAVISNIIELKDSIVYGVEIPGTEGRAGMVAIVDPDDKLDIEKLANGLKTNLPGYAIPIFMRIMKEIPLTGTFKLKKTDLQKEGFDVSVIKDQLYFYDSKLSKYVPLTNELYADIFSGAVKL